MSRVITDLTAGTLLYIDETVSGVTNHVPYIYLGVDENNNARVLRQYVEGTTKSMGSASYPSSNVDAWLENTTNGFLTRFDAATINSLVNTSIKYPDYTQSGDNSVQILSVSRRCFILSSTEYGFTWGEANSLGISYLAALQTFTGQTGNNARKTYDSSGTARNNWERTTSTTTTYNYINGSAGWETTAAIGNANHIRPALSISASTPVSDEGAESIFLLPTGRVTTWNIDMKMKVGESTERPSKVRVDLPTSGISSTTIQVTNNYGDTSPTWVTVQNGSSATLSNTTKTTTNWEIGVKIQAASNTPSGYIGEPVVIISAPAEYA